MGRVFFIYIYIVGEAQWPKNKLIDKYIVKFFKLYTLLKSDHK